MCTCLFNNKNEWKDCTLNDVTLQFIYIPGFHPCSPYYYLIVCHEDHCVGLNRSTCAECFFRFRVLQHHLHLGSDFTSVRRYRMFELHVAVSIFSSCNFCRTDYWAIIEDSKPHPVVNPVLVPRSSLTLILLSWSSFCWFTTWARCLRWPSGTPPLESYPCELKAGWWKEATRHLLSIHCLVCGGVNTFERWFNQAVWFDFFRTHAPPINVILLI